MATKVIFDRVSKQFPLRRSGGLLVIDRFDLAVLPGEFAVLLGPSGCGKTTLLRLLAGLETPDSGRITVDETPVCGPDKSRGMVFQSYSSFPWLTVLDNVLFGLRLSGGPRNLQRETAARYLKLVGLDRFQDYYPDQLSGGMKQRVALARTLAVNPEILLMDEPFAALDYQSRLLMQELVLRIWTEEKRTVIFVTHDVDEALFLADRIFVCSMRPTHLEFSMHIPFPRPRLDELRTQASFGKAKNEIQREIRRQALRSNEIVP